MVSVYTARKKDNNDIRCVKVFKATSKNNTDRNREIEKEIELIQNLVFIK